MDGFLMLVPLVAIVGSLSTAAFITWAISKSRERRAQMQADVQGKLIERFGSAAELVTFLQSPAGREFVTGVQSAPIVATRDRAIANLTRALVLMGIGGAFLALWGIRSSMGFAIPGFILFSIGLANLVGAVVSIKLAKSMGQANNLTSGEIGDTTY